MSYKTSKSFAARMDDLANWTGLPALLDRMEPGKRRPRHLRWFSIIALGLVTIGFGAIIIMTDRFWLGYAILIVGNLIGGVLPLFGPIKPWGSIKGVDERDRQVRRDAYFFAFAVMSAVAVLGLFLLVGLSVADAWTRTILLREMAALVLYLMSLWSIVPTLQASWATDPIEGD